MKLFFRQQGTEQTPACNICDKRFKSNKNVMDHVRRVHKISAAGYRAAKPKSKTAMPRTEEEESAKARRKTMASLKAMRDSNRKFDAMLEEEAQIRATEEDDLMEEEDLLPAGMNTRPRRK